MHNFKITSMFVGILLEESLFSDLFTQLTHYLKENNLEESIILQNLESLHLSLYYLSNNLPIESSGLLIKARKDLGNLELNIISFNYFYEKKVERIAYFETNNADRLNRVNQIFKSNIPNKVLDNQYSYIPHITLLKIIDSTSFKKHKKNLEKIFMNCINELKNKNVFKSVNIFQVDSTKEPEQQIAI